MWYIFCKGGLRMKQAFTLAEVLITLSIIGVVAALTLPSLISKNNTAAMESKLKKTYSVLSQSLLFAAGELGGLDAVEFKDGNTESTEEMFYTYLEKYLKISKKCVNSKGCWAQARDLRGVKVGAEAGIGSNIITFTTYDGLSICMDGKTAADMAIYYGIKTNKDGLVFYIDVNGMKNPNTFGKDIFLFGFSDKGLLPAGKNSTPEQIENSCSASGNGYLCASKVMGNGWHLEDENL